MTVALPLPFLTPEQYLEIEEKAEFKSEYWEGQMYAMAGGTPRHSDASGGALTALRNRLKGKRCGVFNSDLRLRDAQSKFYTYPDIAIVCAVPEFDAKHTLTNPIVLVEVLSPSTEAHDRGFKFERYQHITTLRDYVLIAQDKARVEIFSRQPDNSWHYQAFEGLDATALIPAVDVLLPLQEIYDGVTFADWFKT